MIASEQKGRLSEESTLEALLTGLVALLSSVGHQRPVDNGGEHGDTTAFAEVFPKVAQEHDAALVPFVLEGVGGVPSLMQNDGIHPTAEAQPKLLENVWPTLKPLL